MLETDAAMRADAARHERQAQAKLGPKYRDLLSRIRESNRYKLPANFVSVWATLLAGPVDSEQHEDEAADAERAARSGSNVGKSWIVMIMTVMTA
eukprot:COSAG01_NODE_28223_length_666_cov_0.941799_2_plen_94_part_01